MSLFNFIVRQIEKTPDKVFLQFEKNRITYNELYNNIGGIARGLHECGVTHGDKVCIMMNNCPEYIDVWFALSYLKAVSVPINVHLKGEGLHYLISHSDCNVVVLDEDFLPYVAEVISNIKREIVFIVRKTNGNYSFKEIFEQAKYIPFEQLGKDKEFPYFERTSSSDLNNILYTSGTTGRSKGVMLSDDSYLQSSESFINYMCQATSDDILFTTLPLFHINAQAHTVLGGIYANATIAFSKKFSASLFWDEVRYHKATIFNSLGSMIPILYKQPKKENDCENPARLTVCAATPKEFWKPFEERFGVRIIEGYGLTETTGFCMSNPMNRGKISSFGKPFPGVSAKIVNDSNEEIADGEVGEILIKAEESNILMDGYYKMPEKTLEVLDDGWFRTGDRGYKDPEGYFYFSSRKKDVIRRRGENVSAWEVERIVNNHPKVVESAAIGVLSEVGEEDIKIFIILKQNEKLSPEGILDWCVEKMAYFMVPRYVEFVDEFPKTSTERIQKYKLIEKGNEASWDREAENYVIKR